MRRLTNSLTTIDVVTPASFSLANPEKTCASYGSASSASPQSELGSAGADGMRSRGLHAVASAYTHYFRNPLASGWSMKSMPEPVVVTTT